MGVHVKFAYIFVLNNVNNYDNNNESSFEAMSDLYPLLATTSQDIFG